MTEPITKGISRIFSSSLHCFHRQPSILYPYWRTNGPGQWNNVPQRNKGVVSGGNVTNTVSGRKGIIGESALTETLQLGKINKKAKSKGKLFKENGNKKEDFNIFSTSANSKKTKVTKTSENTNFKNRSYGSFVASLNLHHPDVDRNARNNTKSSIKQTITQTTETSSLPNPARMINLARASPTDVFIMSRSGNTVNGQSNGSVSKNIPMSILNNDCVNKLSSKKSKLSGKKTPKNKKKKQDPLDNIKWFPNQASLYKSKFLGLDRLDLDLTGSKSQVKNNTSAYPEVLLPLDESFENQFSDLKKEDIVRAHDVNKNERESIGSRDNSKTWSVDLPITGYDDLLMNEKMHRLTREDVECDGKLSKLSTNCAYDATPYYGGDCNDCKSETFPTQNNDVSTGFILVDDFKSNDELSKNEKHRLLSEEDLDKIVKAIDSDNFSKNVDELIVSLQTDGWESEVERKLEGRIKSELKAPVLRATVKAEKNRKDVNDRNTSQDFSMVPDNTSSISTHVGVRELMPNVVKSSQLLAMTPSKLEKQAYYALDCSSNCSGPVLSVRPDEIISKKMALSNLSQTSLDSEDTQSLTETLMTNIERSQALSKTLPQIWSSSEKLLELRRNKVGTAGAEQQQLRALKGTNKACENLNSKEFDLASELKETYKNQFRERFQQMLYDQRIKQRLGTLPMNTLVHTPNSQAKWISDLTEMARSKVDQVDKKLSKKQKKKNVFKSRNETYQKGGIVSIDTNNETTLAGSSMSFKNSKSNGGGTSKTSTTISSDKKFEDFLKQRDEMYHEKILNLKGDYPSSVLDDALAKKLNHINGLVTMTVERVYDDVPTNKTIVKTKKTNNQKIFEELVMNRYKMALRRYHERQQKEKGEKNKKRKNKNNAGNKKHRKNKPSEQKLKVQRGSGHRNVDG